MSKPDLSPDALKATLQGWCHQVSVGDIVPVQTFIHDKDHVILTQDEDVIVLHAGMLVKIVNFLNSQTNPKTGDFLPVPERTNVN